MGKCISKDSLNSPKLRQSTQDANEDSLQEIENYLHTQTYLSKTAKSLIFNSLKNHFLFADISKGDMDPLYENLQYFLIPPNEVVFKQGAQGKRFYLIESGQVEVVQDGILKVVLGEGEMFGEISLVTNAPRRASVLTMKQTFLWGLSREGFNTALRAVYEKNYSINKSFISNLTIFKNLSESTKDLLTRACIQHTYSDNFRILCEGDHGSMLFILKNGNAVAKLGNVEKFRINPGEMFGESVVFSPETLINTSIYSVGKAECLSIDKESMTNILGNNFAEVIYKTIAKHSLDSDRILGMLPSDHISLFVEKMNWIVVEPEDVVCEAESSSSVIFTLCFGSFAAGTKVFSENECFGLNNANWKEVKRNGIKAVSRGVIGIVDAGTIEEVTKNSCKVLKSQLKIIKFFTKVEFLSDLSLHQLRYLSSKAKTVLFDSKEVIFNKTDKCTSFYIVRKGKIEIFDKNKTIRILSKFDIFGESSLKEAYRPRTAVSKTSSVCLEIPSDQYLSLNNSLEFSRINSRKSLMSLFTLNQVLKIDEFRKNYYKISFSASLGDMDPQFYVVVINKNTVDSVEICQQLVQSKNVAVYSEHPLLTKYFKSFIDSSFVYIFYDYIEIFPFKSVPKKCFTEDYVKFVAACLVWIIEYLHNKNIVYRNISPDCIGLRENGYIILTSYTPAAIIPSKWLYTEINPLFAAPEMLESKSYTKAVDLWSLGVLIYNCLYSTFPFGLIKSDSKSQIFTKIMENPLEFPKNNKLFRAEEVIRVLLSLDPKKRSCIKEIKYMKWFGSVDFARITTQLYKPGFLPSFSGKKKQKTLISLQRYVHEKFDNGSMPIVKFAWDKFF